MWYLSESGSVALVDVGEHGEAGLVGWQGKVGQPRPARVLVEVGTRLLVQVHA